MAENPQSEVEVLKRLLAESERSREEEQRRREEEQRRREEEQRRREEAEAQIRSTTLTECLEQCRNLSASISIITDASSSTRGDVTNPRQRLCPRRIVVSHDDWHLPTWNKVPGDCSFATSAHFPSLVAFKHVKETLPQVSSEPTLQHFHSRAVDDMVKILVMKATEDPVVKEALQLDWKLDIQDHANIGDDANFELSAAMRELTMAQNEKRKARDESPFRHRGTPDQYYVATSDLDGSRRLIAAIEAKAPHKLSRGTVVRGLEKSIDVFEEVVNNVEEPTNEDENDRWWCRRLMTAVIVQLYSQMVPKRIRRGCVITGDADVELRIGDDPSIVEVKVNIPSLDYDPDDLFRLHQTAVARMFAFVVEAATVPKPGEAWSRTPLSPWKEGSVIDILRQMPDSVKSNTNHSAYKPGRVKHIIRSPIKTRSCKPAETGDRLDTQSSESDGDQDAVTSPSVRKLRQRQATQQEPRGRGRAGSSRRQSAPSSGHRRHDSLRPTLSHNDKDIRKASYCSHACLLGLLRGSVADPHCPNQPRHLETVPTIRDFLSLVRRQLDMDLGPDADCVELDRYGARGSLFKVRLSSHGYTFVAKAARAADGTKLSQEEERYHKMCHLQGDVVPVCLGIIKLDHAYHSRIGRVPTFLLLSYGGVQLDARANLPYLHLFRALGEAGLDKLHSSRMLHGDTDPRNVLFDCETGKLMFVDLENRDHDDINKGLTSECEKRRFSSALISIPSKHVHNAPFL